MPRLRLDSPERRAIEQGEIVYDPRRPERRLQRPGAPEFHRTRLSDHWLFPVVLMVAVLLGVAAVVFALAVRGHV